MNKNNFYIFMASLPVTIPCVILLILMGNELYNGVGLIYTILIYSSPFFILTWVSYFMSKTEAKDDLGEEDE